MEEHQVESVLLEHLGRICTTWSTTEAHLGALLAFLLQANQLRMFLITDKASGATIISWIRTLCELDIEDQTIFNSVKDLLDLVDETRLERNSLVHGLWRPGPEPGTVIVQSLRLDRREVMKDEFFTLTDLKEVLHRIAEINTKLHYIGRQLGYYLS